MRKRKIILLTHAYPYNPPTEQFLDNEMQYLLDKFDDVIVVPTSREINTNNKYIIDKRVKIMPIKRKNKIFEFLMGLYANTLFNRFYWKELSKILTESDNDKRRYIVELTNSYIRSGYCTIQLKKNVINHIENKQDEILLYSYWFNNNIILAAKFKEYLLRKDWENVKLVTRAHGQGDLYVEYRPQIELINKAVDRIFSISKNGLDYLVKHGIKKNLITINRLGVKKQLDSTPNESNCKIVSCSTLNQNKRVERIIESLALIPHINIKWIHFGDGILLKEIVDLCEEKLPPNIDWEIRGKTPNNEIINYYLKEQPSCLINVSYIEGIPVSIMEAFSCKIPVIATNVGATNELVDHERNGFLINRDFKNEELALLIVKMCSDKTKSAEMGVKAYNNWEKYYNSEINFSIFANTCVDLFSLE